MKLIKTINSLPDGVKASTALFTASVVTSGISYIVTPIYTRMLSTAEYGQTSVFMTWQHLFGIIAMFCLSAGVFNNGMIDYPNKRDDYSFSMLILSNLITISFSAIVLCIFPIIKEYIHISFELLMFMCFSFLFTPAYNFWTSKQRYEYKYKWTFFWSILSAIASPLSAIICIRLFPSNRLYARIVGAQGALLLIHLVFYFYLGFKNKFKINTKYWKKALLFNLPLIPHYLSTYLLSSSDRLMISHLINDSATGFYSVAYSVASFATIMWSAINSSLIPFTYENCKKGNYKSIAKVTNVLLTVFAIGCLLIIMLGPEVVAIMATSDYSEAIYVIPPIIGGVFFQVQYFLYANVVYYFKKPKYVMVASITATCVNLVLNYIFIPKYGYIAAGYTTIICYIMQAIIDFFAMKNVAKNSIYNMKYIIILSILVIFISLLSNFLYVYRIIRFIIVGICLIISFVYRNRIVKSIKMIRK